MKGFRKILASILCACMVLAPCGAVYATEDTESAGRVTKDESVYLILNPDGSVKEQTVSSWLHADKGLKNVTDKSDLKDIKNIKSDVAPSQNGQNVTWDTDDHDVYYNGTSGNTPPVTAKITYTLDGKEISAEDLIGKSGELTIRIKLTNNEKQEKTIDGAQRTIYTPFAVGMVLDLPNETFKNVNAGDTNILSDANNQIITFVGLPGVKENFDGLLTDELSGLNDYLQDEFTVKTKVENFKMPSIMMAAATNLADLKDINLNDQVTDLQNGMKELQSASEQLTEGTGMLTEALSEFDSKMGEFKDSYAQFGDGFLSAVNGASQLKGGTVLLSSSLQQLKTKVTNELIPGIQGSSSKQQELVQKMEALQKQLEGLQLPDLTAIQSQLVTAIGQVSDGSADVAVRVLTGGKTLQQLATSSNPVEQAQAQAILQNLQPIKKQAGQQISQMMSSLDLSVLQSLQSELVEINTLSSDLMDSMTQLTSALYNPNDDPANPQTMAGAILSLAVGAKQADDGASTLYEGLEQLGSASGQIEDATGQFKDATGQLADKSSELNDGMQTFKSEGIDSLTNSGLVDKLNTVQAVGNAMVEQADAYTTYSGAPDGAETTVKFIMKVDETVKSSNQENAGQNSAPVDQKENFWDKIVNFFKNLFK